MRSRTMEDIRQATYKGDASKSATLSFDGLEEEFVRKICNSENQSYEYSRE